MLVYLNGEFLPSEEAKISVDDRAFLFGDGVYEVTRVVHGQFFGEEGHWLRLQNGLEMTAIGTESVDRYELQDIYRRLIRENGLEEGHATVYLQVTRGCAPRTHQYPDPPCAPTVYAFAKRFAIPDELRANGVAAITRPDLRWMRCDIKTVNLLPNVMAKQAAVEAGAWEAVLVRNGVITEGSATNVFGVIDGEIRTHPKSNFILPGITRDIVIDLAHELGLPVRETPIFLDQVPQLDEMFFTGTTTDVQAIVELDGRKIGDGKVGPVARKLLEALTEKMHSLRSAAV